MELTIRVPVGAERVNVLGSADRNLKMIREALGVNIAARDGSVRVSGDRPAVTAAGRVIERLRDAARRQESPSRQRVLEIISGAAAECEGLDDATLGALAGDGSSYGDTGPAGALNGAWWEGRLDVYTSGRQVQPKTENQEAYLEAIRTHDLVFGIGPAGTGKTYLAVAAAVHMLKRGRARRVILVRPAVEAGEKLGYLPGDMEAKVNPYLRPLLDALHDMMDFATLKRFLFNDVIEVAPLAFMRGRTLNDAVIILDEAQNTTRGQMQMFLTRMGQRSKMIVTGDTTQIDLPDPTQSGLVDACRRLRRVRGIGFIQLGRGDIVRHDLVQRIVDAYGEIADSDSSRPDIPG